MKPSQTHPLIAFRLIAFRGTFRATALAAALALAFVFPLAAMALDDLAACEQALFSHSYEGDSTIKRLERLEESIFGEVQAGSESSRSERLVQLLGKARRSVPSVVQADTPASGSQNAPSPEQPYPGGQPYGQQMLPPRPPDATDYPKITALERQVFGRDFIRDDITNRLSRLEKKVFGQEYPQSSLVDRSDKLLSRYPNLNIPASAGQDSISDMQSAGSNLQTLPSDSKQFVGSSRDVYAKVDALEKKVLNGKTFPNQLLTERLDRLEAQVYGRAFGGESIDGRVQRLVKSFEVPNGSQPRPAFQDRQAYQPPSDMPITSYASPEASSPPVRQNIQIGAGLSENSSYRFSNDLLEMLPPDVRAQVGGRQVSSSATQGTVVSSPGTVILQQTTQSPAGFSNYGGAPIQYQNYYGVPAPQIQSQTTTTVIQPDGSSQVYSYPTTTPLPGVQMNPAYIGNPALLRDLEILEARVFGQVNMIEPVNIRLSKLESAIIGQVYPSYPDAQRLDNLKRTHQMQSIGRLMGNGKAGQIGRSAGSAVLGIPLTSPMPQVIMPPGTTGGGAQINP